MADKWKIDLSKKTQIGRFEITEEKIKFPDGHAFEYSYVDIKDGICILPIINNKIGLIKQYRHIMQSYEWEVPAGMIDEGEAPIETAKRELLEETGYRTNNIRSLGLIYPSVGSTTEKIHLFYAECTEKGQSDLDATEEIEVFELSIEDVKAMIEHGDIKHAAGIIAIYKYLSTIK